MGRRRVTTGLEAFLAEPPRSLAKARLGLLCNQASVDAATGTRATSSRGKVGRRLTALFSPQHGIFGEKQDNMVESAHGRDPVLGIPVYSLYADVRRPTAEMFAGIDALLVDLQDVGCRVYTFITTLRYCLEEAARLGKKVVVLDRPNPIGGAMEGNLLDPSMLSFVGAHRLPMRHGLTMGELARLFVAEGRHRRRPRGGPAARLAPADALRRHRPALGAAEPEHADTRHGARLPRPGAPRGDAALGGAGHHAALRDLRRALDRPRAAVRRAAPPPPPRGRSSARPGSSRPSRSGRGRSAAACRSTSPTRAPTAPTARRSRCSRRSADSGPTPTSGARRRTSTRRCACRSTC